MSAACSRPSSVSCLAAFLSVRAQSNISAISRDTAATSSLCRAARWRLRAGCLATCRLHLGDSAAVGGSTTTSSAGSECSTFAYTCAGRGSRARSERGAVVSGERAVDPPGGVADELCACCVQGARVERRASLSLSAR